MMQKHLWFAAALAIGLAACQRAETPAPAPEPGPETAAPPAAPSPAEPAPTPAIDAIETVDAPMETEGAFDRGAFAGTFAAGTTRLELKPDGSYLINDGAARMDGTWTTEAGDRHVRLDPNSKAEDDRLFAISSRDELAPLTAQGAPAASAAALRRETGATSTQQ